MHAVEGDTKMATRTERKYKIEQKKYGNGNVPVSAPVPLARSDRTSQHTIIMQEQTTKAKR